MPLFPQHFSQVTSRLKLGLFSRSFLLLAALMLVSLGAWLQVFFSMEEGPRAIQMAQRVTTSVSITRSALVYAPPTVRPALMLDLATKESLRVQPREPTDTLEPLPNSNYWNHVAAEIKKRQGANTQIMWAVNNAPGIWVSFDINKDHYWLVFDREQLGLTAGIEWFSWGATALLLALIGSAISVRFVNRPLAQLAKVAQQLARGESPSPLPEKGPLEIREMNIAFNRMARDLRQTEADREIMLAGISHDLRTPLARMRLEIEMSEVSDEARQAIDEDLAQIDHSIGQLMEYARPAGAAPEQGIDVSRVLHDLYERERSHTESLGGHLGASIAPNLYARITAHDLKRVVGNLIENARRYGRSKADDCAYIHLSAKAESGTVAIEVTDQGSGIAEADISRLLRPFSRGESARTGVSGAGLGLAIVERLLGQVGGQLKLLSRPSGGLVARIELRRGKGKGIQQEA
ncbi:ATP-binding protein [Eoetvoesiella caeni]